MSVAVEYSGRKVVAVHRSAHTPAAIAAGWLVYEDLTDPQVALVLGEPVWRLQVNGGVISIDGTAVEPVATRYREVTEAALRALYDAGDLTALEAARATLQAETGALL